MAGRKFRIQNVIIVLLLLITIVRCSKLNVPRVLLPIFNGVSSKFTLEATEGGCYKWSTTRQDLIQITIIDEDPDLKCTNKVVVSTVTKEANRNIAVVLAEDVYTKHLLRCDVVVDVIHSLAVSTTTRELFMEEAPETFEVKAHDDQGNEFSSMEDIELDWNIVPVGPNKDEVVRYMTFRASPYESPPGIAALENDHKKGYIILLKGVKSGSVKVSVRLPYPEYKEVETIEVQLTVVANLLLTPGEVYIMPGDVITFKVFYLNNGRMVDIPLPDAQYYIESDNMEIASSLKKSGDVTALRVGDVKVELRDRNVGKHDLVLKLPACNVHVVNPDYLVLSILPHKNWAILVGDHHDIIVDVYSSDDHKIFVGNGVQIIVDVSAEFYVTSRSPNGSWLTGYGMQSSMAEVEAMLDGVYSSSVGKIRFDTPLTTRSDLLIFPRITISPSEVILPWDPVSKPKYDIDLVAKGGDGKFLWSSSDNAIGVVSQSGHVHTHMNGFFEVSAAMLRNHHNRHTTKFMILPASRLEIVEFVMEAELGAPVHLHVALYAEHKGKDGNAIHIPFTQCQSVPFQIKQSDTKFRQNKTEVLPPVGISCGNVAMVGLNVGTSKVTITYFIEGRALEDSVTVSAYKPLVLLEPKREVVLALGTSINLVYAGGPRPQVGKSSKHTRVVVSDDEDVVQAVDISNTLFNKPGEDISVVQVLCKSLGETDIKLMITNSPVSANCVSKTSSVITRVTCGKPRKVALEPRLQIADPDSCPMDLSSGHVVVQGSNDIDIEVVVYDDCGSKFLNISSLELQWTVQPPGSARLLVPGGVFPRNITVANVHVAHKSYQQLKPLRKMGDIELNVTVTGYKVPVLSKYGITAESPAFTSDEDKLKDLPDIKTTLSLYLVDDTVIESKELILFNHPGNKKFVKVKQGSGFFELALSADGVALVNYRENSRRLEITPIDSGELTIQLIDLCLISKPATLFVTVVSVGILRVEVVDKVEIGKCIPCIVRLYDENDNLMVIPEPGMVEIRPIFENTIANIQKADDEKKWGVGELHFVITGAQIGDTKLVFAVTSGDSDVTSAPANLQVFLPLKLHPRNGTILVGANFQFAIKGGPQPDSNILFTVLNSKVAEVNDKGIIHGNALGVTKISAKCTGMHPTTGKNIVYSEDTVEIKVVVLNGIKIVAPLTRFQVGNTAAFWCTGLPDISPLVLGSVQNTSIEFKWRIDDNILVDLHNAFHPLGIDFKRADKLSIEATGLQPGKTRLTLNATIPGRTANFKNVESVTFSTFVDIEVFAKFYLTQPRTVTQAHLLMAPFSQLQLETNLDNTASKITFTLPETTLSTEVLADSSVKISDDLLHLSPTGMLKSFGNLGHALLIVIATDEYGMKQRIHVAVEVKPIHYMRVNILSKWRIQSGFPQDYIPLGSQFQIKATFHDNLGNTFKAGPTAIKIRTSRCDLLTVTDVADEAATVLIDTKKAGSTVFKIWADGVEKTADYFKLSVRQSVKPLLDHLTNGDIICLWTPVVSEYNALGQWISSDPSLVAINPALDIGFVGDREGVVVLSHNLLPSAPIHLQVFPVSEIEFIGSTDFLLTNGDADSVVRFVLVLQSEKSLGIKKNNLIQGWRCRVDVRRLVRPKGFTCFFKFSNPNATVSPNEIFNISTSWVPDTGQYACKIVNSGANGSAIATLETNLTVWAITDDGEVESPKMEVHFVPGFYVPREIYQTEDNNFAILNVVGLPHVLQQTTVEPMDSSIVFVNRGSYTEQTVLSFKVQLVDYHWRLANLEEAMGIVVKSPLTKQTVKVLLRVSGEIEKKMCGSMGRSPVFVFLQSYKHSLLTAVAMIIIFFLTFYFYSNYMQPVVNVNVNPRPSRPLMTTTSTPTAAAAFYSTRLNSSSPTTSPIAANRSQAGCQHHFNCSCTGNTSREPIYGDPSSFYSSPEVRRNRRGM